MTGRITVLGELARAMGAAEAANAGLLLVASVGIIVVWNEKGGLFEAQPEKP